MTVTEFILDKIERSKITYANEPELIVQHFLEEQRIQKEYNGRQLLELIQNADDEAFETTKEKKILIELKDNVLIVANNGNPFSIEGINSLFYAGISEKFKKINRIGNKGKGFRSILNWANAVYIKSADLSVEFSEKIAKQFLVEFFKDYPETQNRVKELNKYEVEYPIAVLRAPGLVDVPANFDAFDTYIKIELDEKYLDDVQKQIDELDKEILLFLTLFFLKGNKKDYLCEKII